MGKERVNYLIIGLILYRVAYTFSPFVAFYSPHGLNMISVVTLYLLMFNTFGVQKVISTLLRFLPIYLVSILAIIFSTITGLKMTVSIQVYLLIQEILWVLSMYYIIHLQNVKISRFILYYVIGFIIITSLTTYYGCLKYPGLSRNMTAGETTTAENVLFSTLNVGGFEFIYTIVLTIPFIIYLYKNNQINLVLSLLLIAPILMAVYKAEYTTALLASVICLSSFFFPKIKSNRQFIRIAIIMSMAFLILSTYLSDILLWGSNIIGSDTMAVRLESSSDIASGIGADENSDANARIEVWTKSLNNFFSNPLFGVGDNGGGHSWLFDNMSMFGIWGLFACIIVLRYIYKLIIKPCSGSGYYFILLFVFLLQIILSIVNTMVFFDIFIIITPLVYSAFPPSRSIGLT